MNRKTAWLLTVVFVSGMTSLGIELTASRFIGNYFGSALPVWAAIIGMVLVYLTIGYLLGGRLADRNPDESHLYRLTMWAGFFTGLIPFVANPILQFATVGIREVLACFCLCRWSSLGASRRLPSACKQSRSSRQEIQPAPCTLSPPWAAF
jgi:MFS family permease